MSITKKYEFPLSDIMDNVRKEIEALDPEQGGLIEHTRNEWEELYKHLDKAHSQVLRLDKIYKK